MEVDIGSELSFHVRSKRLFIGYASRGFYPLAKVPQVSYLHGVDFLDNKDSEILSLR